MATFDDFKKDIENPALSAEQIENKYKESGIKKSDVTKLRSMGGKLEDRLSKIDVGPATGGGGFVFAGIRPPR